MNKYYHLGMTTSQCFVWNDLEGLWRRFSKSDTFDNTWKLIREATAHQSRLRGARDVCILRLYKLSLKELSNGMARAIFLTKITIVQLVIEAMANQSICILHF